MQSKAQPLGLIRADELYTKQEFLRRVGGSQKLWDKMLDEGLPFSKIGHAKCVIGKDVIEHLSKHSERKRGT